MPNQTILTVGYHTIVFLILLILPHCVVLKDLLMPLILVYLVELLLICLLCVLFRVQFMDSC